MNRRWKRPAIFLGVIVAVVIVARIVLGLLLPGETIRQLAVDQAVEATGAEVTLGQASVRLLPRIAVTMGQGSIAGTGRALAEKAGLENSIGNYAVDVDRLSIDLKIGPLLRGRIELGTARLASSEWELETQDGTIRMEGFELEISDLSLPASAVGETKTTGPGESLPPGEAIPAELSLNFDVEAERLFWQGVPYDEVKVQGELDALIFLVESFSAERSGGLVVGELEVDFERDPWGILDFEATVTEVPSAALLEPWAPDLASRLDCALSGEISGGGQMKDPDTVTRTLNLTGALNSGQGVLRAGDWLDGIADYLGDRQDLKDIRFDQLDHSFRVSQGQYLIEDLTLEGPDTDWTGGGWVGLDGTIDVDLGVKLPAGFTPDLGQWSFLAEGLRDEEQRVNLALHLTGQSAQPQVGLKLGGGKDSEAPNAADALKKGLGGFLDKLKTK
jgi:AsmA-like C-terminal region